MNDAAFGKSERLLQGWHVYWGHDADYEDCDMCSQGRAELANARKLLEAADSFLTWVTDMEYLLPVEKLQLLESAIAACRAETGKNQNA